MPENPQNQNTPLTLENFWKILDSQLVSLGTPAALVAVALDFARKSEWQNAALCVVAAVAVWFLIKIGNKIDPRIDKYLDSILDNAEILLQNLWAKLTSHFEGKYYERLRFDCREYETQGINQETLLLENLFVPLKIVQKTVGDISQNIIQQAGVNPLEQQEIGNLLVRMTRDDIKQRLVILGAPGSGKSTLLRHITLMYATRRQRRLDRKAPKLVPVLLELRKIYQYILQDPKRSLVDVIENAVSQLQSTNPLEPRKGWFGKRLEKGKCLVMLDGLDEIADDAQRQKVSEWVSKKIDQNRNTPFILTSRPEGYRKAPLQGNVLELEVQPFTRKQRDRFIQDWYLCRKKQGNENKVDSRVRDNAKQQANNLITQINASASLKVMATNPLLLNMIALTHKNNPPLPTKPVELYKQICNTLLKKWEYLNELPVSLSVEQKLLNELPVSLSVEQKLIVLRSLALKLMEENTQAFTLDEFSSRDKTFKQAKTLIQQKLDTFLKQTLTPENFITKDEHGVRELLIEREQEGIYEFAHKTFQEYLAAVEIKKSAKEKLLVDAFAHEKTLAWWRETIRFYAAQTDASSIIKAALNYATVPVLTLAYQCSKEAQHISESVQQQLKAKFEEGLKSEKLDEFTLAAEVRLASRLNQLNQDLTESNFQTESSDATIDHRYITHAEYQLFLNETNSPTNSPTTPANKRDVEQPITNISFWDANRFCAWLSLRTRKELGEPGICYKPATQTEKQQHPCEEDKEYAEKEGIRLIRFGVPTRYAQLAYYLAAGEWKEADEETNKVMLEVAGREKQGYLEFEDIRQFPCEDLRIIDKLWVEYSNGHFGFSVQKKIYLQVGGKLLEENLQRAPWEKVVAPITRLYARIRGKVKSDEYEAYVRFSDRVGWIVNNNWVYSEGVIFDTTSPIGHLPKSDPIFQMLSLETQRLPTWLTSRVLFSRVETCKL